MGASSTATTATSATSAATSGLVEQVSFQRINAGLAQHGITLSAAEQARLEEIARDEIRKQNGGQLAGMNIGGMGVNLIEILFSLIKNLFDGGNASIPTTLAGLGEHLSNAASGATNTGKQYVINTINANIYERMRAEGGSLAQAADLVTGLATGGGNARNMDGSLMHQLTSAQNTEGVSTTLNRPVAVADASGGNGLPPQLTRPLTSPAVGA